MTPPETPVAGQEAGAAERAPAVSSCPGSARPPLAGLTRRAEFLKAAQARRQGTAGFLLQARRRGEGEADPALIRVGFTASKKIGNAVLRNRAKRRLRAVAREVLPEAGQPGWDYVLVARPEATLARPYGDLVADLRRALAGVHGTGRAGR
jgi:ribonuclease P protein component